VVVVLKSAYVLPSLPPAGQLETREVLRAAARAHRHLAELKGRATAIPNPNILIDTLLLQEARASSEIENIFTTQEEMLQAAAVPESQLTGPAKEVALYRDALKRGWSIMQSSQGLLTNNTIIEMFRILKGHTGGFRETPGTALKNQNTGAIVYVPPQDSVRIVEHMTALEIFINESFEDSILDPLVKMAVIHHQFESIHPFPDGNGRIGRIVNVLFLTRAQLLHAPILYLSRAINLTKSDYYRLLQATRDTGSWEPWLLYMLRAVAETSIDTLAVVDGIGKLMTDYKMKIRSNYPKLYSQDLINNMFRHPYTKIEYLQTELGVTRQTAAKYLEELVRAGYLTKSSVGKQNFYINEPLVRLFTSPERKPNL
jgi:Fic family protein